MSAPPTTHSLSLTIHAAALLILYTLYGVFQEKIMKGTYGPNQARFTSSALLIVFNRTWSILTGLAIMYLKTRSNSNNSYEPVDQAPAASIARKTFRERLTPASHMSAYAAVAVFNFLSTSCQYEALRYVSYSTQSLAKCAKVVPVLLIGSLIWKKAYRRREWLAALIIVTGCGLYVYSPAALTGKVSKMSQVQGEWDSLIGAAFLVGYLAFDGLTSTTQERVFGHNPKTSDPFDAASPVLDQMIWVNLFAGAIALASMVLSAGVSWDNVGGSLKLLATSGSLGWDVTLFSMTSAIGLIVLLNTIASFGALTSSTIMTIRQFLSILVNAQIYGSIISFQGWLGIATVGGGIWLKMYRGLDEKSKGVGAGAGVGGGKGPSLTRGEEQELDELLKEDTDAQMKREGESSGERTSRLEQIIVQ